MREIASPLLSQRTTLRLGGTAIAELILENPADVAGLPDRLRALGGAPVIMGAGSNILAQDGDLPLVLVRPNFTRGPEVVGESAGKVFVRAGAAVPLPRLLRFCATHGLAGLEGLVGIPGTVGGAVAMNAGSFGVETCRKIENIHIASNGEVRVVVAQALQYSYRSLCIDDKKNDFIVLEATFGLTRTARDGISNCMRHNFFEKKSKQPVTAWSAGCVFKNPSPEMPAGKLLDQAGFKGKKMGGMAFSTLHANFMINEGKGSATAALALMQEAKEAVLERFGIALEPEVRIIPCLFP
ncbi:MAG: UDP-N-acetylenolpyruvoylglucosamine reductase [Desulfovibrio sp. MES5]|uniref:UDP-N-acetylmuramate dehydrogenase n=1 Tax=Desulfovibrio sp. MES5 TaxID=1899016 RepID=UPI000B9D13F6|nr:UDP-N-acetylmuramate dehydrogenase [Desulfovibrio sp. MES5]OXS27857.1 MAG: UDP-N-acetylenolpyruvoylglucosamine reductase [Desulfovibrio sp. MES5]